MKHDRFQIDFRHGVLPELAAKNLPEEFPRSRICGILKKRLRLTLPDDLAFVHEYYPIRKVPRKPHPVRDAQHGQATKYRRHAPPLRRSSSSRRRERNITVEMQKSICEPDMKFGASARQLV